MPVPNLADRFRETTPASRPATPEVLPEPTQTDLVHWPPSAMMTPWIIPVGTNRALPWKQSPRHISHLIEHSDTVILISFRDPTDWKGIVLRMIEAEELGVSTMILAGTTQPNILGALLWGAGDRAADHGRAEHADEKAVFVASEHLQRILGIDARSATRNSVTLIHKGRVRASWVSMNKDGSGPHDWSGIRRTIELIEDDEPTEVLELE